MKDSDMGSDEFDVERVTTYWLTEAKESLQVTDHLVEKRDYSYALFFGHLAIEKVLKVLYAIKMREHAPPIHNLLRLSRSAGLPLNKERTESLITVTTFNIEASYPDMKRTFRQKCTPEYTMRQMKIIKEAFEWLVSLMP